MAVITNIHTLAHLSSNDYLYGDSTPQHNTDSAALPAAAATKQIHMLDDILHYSIRRKPLNANTSDSESAPNYGSVNSRRYRRYLNSQLSDTDGSTSESEVEDIDLQVVTFEWKSVFNQLDNTFYSDAQTIDTYYKQLLLSEQLRQLKQQARPVDRALERAQRRARKLHKLTYNADKHHHHANKQHKHRTISTTASDSIEDDPASNIEFTSDSSDSDTALVHTEQSQQKDLTDSVLADELYNLINKNVRHTYLGMYDYRFMTELESVLVPYKTGELTAKQLSHAVLSTIKVSHASNNTLVVQFIDQFHMYLASGAVIFHQLRSSVHGMHTLHVTVQQPSIHTFRLVKQIRLAQQQRNSAQLPVVQPQQNQAKRIKQRPNAKQRFARRQDNAL